MNPSTLREPQGKLGSGQANLAPSPERRQHSRVVRDRAQIADTAGRIGNPWRAEGLLGKLERNGDISREQATAGETFASFFRQAALDTLQASNPHGPAMHRSTHAPHSPERPRRIVNDALDALGGLHSPCGACAWHVLGCEASMRDFALRQAWHGKPIQPHVAKGVLLATLGVLAKHWGYEKPPLTRGTYTA